MSRISQLVALASGATTAWLAAQASGQLALIHAGLALALVLAARFPALRLPVFASAAAAHSAAVLAWGLAGTAAFPLLAALQAPALAAAWWHHLRESRWDRAGQAV